MGGGMSLQDNQEVSHESGAGRLMNSIVCAICVAPILLIAMTFTVGFNEKRAVCDAKAIVVGMDQVQPIGCDLPSDGSGRLVMLSCDIQKTGLDQRMGSDLGDFSGTGYVGTGLKVKTKMLQCVEHTKKSTTKDKIGGGETTVTTFTYTTEWKDQWVDSRNFKKRFSREFDSGCGADNPTWPRWLPKTQTRHAPTMTVGAVRTDKTSSVPLDTLLSLPVPSSNQWRSNGAGVYGTDALRSPSGRGIGRVQVEISSNDWRRPRATLLGFNKKGVVVPWKAPSSWMCSSSSLSDLRMGEFSKDELFAALKTESETMTWVLRIFGFLVMWLAFSLCFAPLGVAADCIPCVGPMLGDSVECIGCCVSCLPATACFGIVAGIMWAVMRPFIGIPVAIIGCCAMVGLGGFLSKSRSQKNAGGGVASAAWQNPMYGAAGMVYNPPPPAQPMPGQRQFQVTVPPGCGPGVAVQVHSPDGQILQVAVPPGCGPGAVFAVSY